MGRNRSRSTDSEKENDGEQLEKRIRRLERKLIKEKAKKKRRHRHASSSSRDHNLEHRNKKGRGYDSPTRNWEAESLSSENNTENGQTRKSQVDDAAARGLPVIDLREDEGHTEDIGSPPLGVEATPNPELDDSGAWQKIFSRPWENGSLLTGLWRRKSQILSGGSQSGARLLLKAIEKGISGIPQALIGYTDR